MATMRHCAKCANRYDGDACLCYYSVNRGPDVVIPSEPCCDFRPVRVTRHKIYTERWRPLSRWQGADRMRQIPSSARQRRVLYPRPFERRRFERMAAIIEALLRKREAKDAEH